MGRSGSGKDTLCSRLLGELPDLRPLKLYTTRPRRSECEDGYIFVSPEKLDALICAHGLIERRDYDTVHGVWSYATIDDGLPDCCYACVLTPQALPSYRAHFSAENVLPIFLEVDEGDLLMRSVAREKAQPSPRYAELCRRFLADCADFSPEKLSALEPVVRLCNDDPDECFARLLWCVKDFLRAV